MPRQILEHDDAADEGNPERGAKSGGEAEEVRQFQRGYKHLRILAVRFRSEGFRREDYADRQKRHRRQKSSQPRHFFTA